MGKRSYRSIIEPRLMDRFGSLNKLAGHLDISRQSVLGFLETGRFPLERAMEIEVLSGGDIPWQDLCPEVAARLKELHAVPKEN